MRLRVHFNRHCSDGRVAAVSHPAGLWEIQGQQIECLVPLKSVYQPKETPDEDDGRPSFWLEADGVVFIKEGGKIVIKPT